MVSDGNLCRGSRQPKNVLYRACGGDFDGSFFVGKREAVPIPAYHREARGRGRSCSLGHRFDPLPEAALREPMSPDNCMSTSALTFVESNERPTIVKRTSVDKGLKVNRK